MHTKEIHEIGISAFQHDASVKNSLKVLLKHDIKVTPSRTLEEANMAKWK
jgi:hypothetical protein